MPALIPDIENTKMNNTMFLLSICLYSPLCETDIGDHSLIVLLYVQSLIGGTHCIFLVIEEVFPENVTSEQKLEGHRELSSIQEAEGKGNFS